MSKAQELADALDRMDRLLDPSLGLLTVGNDSATVQGSRADMALIRSALSASSDQRAAQHESIGEMVEFMEYRRTNHEMMRRLQDEAYAAARASNGGKA